METTSRQQLINRAKAQRADIAAFFADADCWNMENPDDPIDPDCNGELRRLAEV